MIQDYHLFQKYPLKSIISLTHINSKYKPPWVHLFHHFFFKMLLIFSDYAAEIWNVPGVAKPALIDLCVRQAKFRHAFITVEVFPFFFFQAEVCVRSTSATLASSHLQAARIERILQHLQGHGRRDQIGVCSASASPPPSLSVLFPLFFWSQSARNRHTDSFLHVCELI